MNTVNTEFPSVEIWFTDQSSKALEIEHFFIKTLFYKNYKGSCTFFIKIIRTLGLFLIKIIRDLVLFL